jgi:hypothetical protein
MILNHGDFEILCALAASGQLTKTEHAELSGHAEHCVLCRNRLVEMRQVGIHLVLAQAVKTQSKQLPKGMQERFAARAINEGIPLSSRSTGVGFSALGLVTVLLVALLLVAATLTDAPFPRSVVETNLANTSQSGLLNKEESPSQRLPNQALPGGLRAGRVLPFRKGHRPSSAVSHADPALLEHRQFPFTPYSLNSGMRAYPFSTAIRLPEVVPSFTSPFRAPKVTFDTTSEIIGHNAPHLLAECEHCAFAPLRFQAHSAGQNFQGSLDPDAYRAVLKVDFEANAIHLIPIVVLQAAQ